MGREESSATERAVDDPVVVEAGGVAPGPPEDVAAPGSMKSSVVSSATWSAVGRMGTQALQFLVGLGLARLLVPADFGLLASVYVVTGFTVLIFDMGLSAALIHQREVRQRDLDTAFWLNAIGGVVFLGLLAALGPLVANFYGDDRLTYITPLAGLSFAFALGVSHSAQLQRAMKFRQLAIIEVSVGFLGNATTLIAAAAGLGPLALVTGPALQSIALTVLLWIVVPWRPRGFIDRESMARLWRFSGGMLGFSIANFAGRNSDNLLIGRFLGASPLGFYNRAYTLMLLPLQQTSQVVGRVMFPALASMGDDRVRLARAYRRTIAVMTAVTMPVLVGMAVVADGLVPLLWGHQWLDTIPLLQVLCLAGLPQCLSSSEGWLYQSQGRTSLMFKMGLLSTVIGVAGIVVGLHWGAFGVACGVFVTAWGYQPFALRMACGTIGLKGSRVILDILPTVSIALGMGAVVWITPLVLHASRESVWVLIVQVLVGSAVYVTALRLFRRRLLQDLVSMVPAKLSPKRLLRRGARSA
ncbi:MAG: MOP flippase family protein [Janthinobacterium lividum]